MSVGSATHVAAVEGWWAGKVSILISSVKSGGLYRLSYRPVVQSDCLRALGDGDELVALVAALLGLLEHGADAADVQLVVDHARLERRPSPA